MAAVVTVRARVLLRALLLAAVVVASGFLAWWSWRTSAELAAVGDVVAMPCEVIWLWTLSKVLVVFVPTALTTRMATMAISASTSPYSTSDCPLLFAF